MPRSTGALGKKSCAEVFTGIAAGSNSTRSTAVPCESQIQGGESTAQSRRLSSSGLSREWSVSGAALRVQLVATHGWGNPAGRVGTRPPALYPP